MCCTKFNSIWRQHRQGTWKKNELGQQWITEAKIFQCQKEQQQQQTVAMNRTCELPFLKNVTYLVVEWLLETLVLGSRYQKYSDRRSSTTSSINVLRFIQQCWMLFLTFFVYSWIFRSRKLQNFEKSSKIFKNVAQIKSLCSSFSQNHFLTDSWRKYWKIGFRVFTYSPTIYALSNVAASPLTHDFTFYKEIWEH